MADRSVMTHGPMMDIGDEPERELGKVTINGSKLQLKVFRQIVSTVVTTGATSVIEITPAVGCKGVIKAIGVLILAVAGATAAHLVTIQIGALEAGNGFESIYLNSVAAGGIISLSPANMSGICKDIPFTADKPLKINYINLSNAAQTSKRMYYVLYEEVPIVS